MLDRLKAEFRQSETPDSGLSRYNMPSMHSLHIYEKMDIFVWGREQ